MCCGGGLLCDSQYLDENKQLILAILDNQNLGKIHDCATLVPNWVPPAAHTLHG